MKKLNLKVIACKIFYREVCCITYNSPHFIDVTWVCQGLHDRPDELKNVLQKELDLIDGGADIHTTDLSLEAEAFDAIVLLYGLCSNGVIGLSSKKYPLIIPRTHDCIAILLGNKKRYNALFNSLEGIYWYSPGWMDCTLMPGAKRLNILKDRYVQNYGEKNADYLMEMEQGWIKEYNHLVFIDSRELTTENYEREARKAATELGWQFTKVEGSMTLLHNILGGDWDDDDILIIPPCRKISSSFDEEVLKVGGEGFV